MSIQKYDAFISYRHAPLDSKIAETIHRQLESFKIPKEIKNKITKKKITRIFRDKEELPVTSDINDNIKQALDNSENLIVICSHSLKDSIWVKREIEYFLESHSIEQVLTVLAEGEPCEVIPEILQYEKTETDKNTGESKKVLCEPLSCDYRLPKKQAKADELPRLAAAILGCSYDDLKQRQKQHRRRIITAALSCVFVFLAAMSVFFAYTANEIQKNYNNALINQSEYLISESQKAYESGDKITATLLAVEALPSEDNERPLLSEAVYNLESIIEPYKQSSVAGYEQSAVLRHDRTIDYYSNAAAFSSDEKYFAIKNGGTIITVWDTESNEIIYEKSFSNNILSVGFTLKNTLIVVFGGSSLCIDISTKEILWEIKQKDFHRPFSGEFVCSPTEEIVIFDTTADFLVINSTDGSEIFSQEYPNEINYARLIVTDFSFSPSGEKFLFTLNGVQVSVCEIKNRTVYTLPEFFDNINAVCFSSDEDILLITPEKSENYSWNSSNGSVMYTNYCNAVKINLSSESVTFETTLEYEGIDYETLVLKTEKETDGTKKGLYVCAVGNHAYTIDSETGKIHESYTLSDSAKNMREIDSGTFCILLDNGSLAYIYTNEDFHENVDFVNEKFSYSYMSGNKICLLSDKSDTDIMIFEYHKEHKSVWKQINTDSTELDPANMVHENDNYVVFYDLSFGNTILVVDKETKTVAGNYLIPEEYEKKSLSLLGVSEDGNKLYISAENTEKENLSVVLAFDIENATVEEIDNFGEYTLNTLIMTNNGYCGYAALTTSVKNESTGAISVNIVNEFIYKEKGSDTITVFDLDSKSFSDVFLTSQKDTVMLKLTLEDDVQPSCKYALLNLSTREMTTIEKEFENSGFSNSFAESPNGKLFAIVEKSRIHVYDYDFNKKAEIPFIGNELRCVSMTNEEILVFPEDNYFYRYDAFSGDLRGRVTTGVMFSSSAVFDFSEKGYIYIKNDSSIDIIDTETWTLFSSLPGGCTKEKIIYNIYKDNDADSYQLYYTNFLDHNELIEMAKEKYPGVTLSEQQKTRYGID